MMLMKLGIIVLFGFVLGFYFDPVFAQPFSLFQVNLIDSLSVASEDTAPQGLAFNTDGTKMFVVGDAGNDILEYTLSSAFDVSTSTFVDSFNVLSQERFLTDVEFSADGTKMFVTGEFSSAIHEYTLSTAFDVSTSTFVDSLSVATEDTKPQGIVFSSEGDKMFITGDDGNDINEYTLSTAFDVSTGNFVDSFSVLGTSTFPRDIAFNSDGTKMFVISDATESVSQYLLSSPFDVSTANFEATFVIKTEGIFPQGLAFSSDGTKMFVANDFNDDVSQYMLSTPFELATPSFTNSFSVAVQDSNPRSLKFSSNGNQMFVLGGNGDDVNEYTLSSPFDVSTATFEDSFSVATEESIPHDFTFSSDGSKMFVVGIDGLEVNQYLLSSPFDVSTATFEDSFSVATEEANPHALAFDSDGTRMYVAGSQGKDVNEYTLSTAFDVSTATFEDSFSISSQQQDPRGIAFNPEGTRMFIVGGSGIAEVNQYLLSSPFDISTALFVGNFSVENQTTNPSSLTFSSDGTKMFLDDDMANILTYNIFNTCTVPSFDDWVLTDSCLLSSSAVILGNVILQNNSLLIIPDGMILDIDFENFHLLVKSGSRVLLESGGAIT